MVVQLAGRGIATAVLLVCAVTASAQQAGEGQAGPPVPPALVTPPLPVFSPPDVPGRPKLSGDLSIEDAVKAALRHSPTVMAAEAEHQGALAQVRGARSMTRPQMSASALAARASADMPMPLTSAPSVMPSTILSMPDRGSAGTAVMLMVPLYTGGRLASLVRSAQEMERSQGQKVRSTAQDVALATRSAYRRALLARATVSVYEDLVRASEERVRVARERYAAGSANLAEVLRNQAALADALQRLVLARSEAEAAVVELKTVMGVSLASDVRLTTTLERTPLEGTVAEVLERALRKRSEVAEAEASLRAAEAEAASARAQYRPQVYLNAMHNVTAVRGDTSKGLGVGVTISIPVVDGGKRSADVEGALARVESAKQGVEAVRLRVAQEVTTAWLAAQAAEVNVKTSEAAVQQAEEDYRIAQLRYEAGKSINVEVLDALAALVQARTNHLQALYELGLAKDRLVRAAGEM